MTDIINKEVDVEEKNSNLDVLLDSITNENGVRKYQTVDVALKALKESQDFIRVLQEREALLKQNNEALESKIKGDEKIEDLINRLKQTEQKQVEDKTPIEKTQVEKDNQGDNAVDFEKLIEAKLKEREQSYLKQSNFDKANKEAIDVCGSKEKAVEAVKRVSQNFNLSSEQLKEMAENSPSAFVTLVKAVNREQPRTTEHLGGGLSSPPDAQEKINSRLKGISSSDQVKLVKRLKDEAIKQIREGQI